MTDLIERRERLREQMRDANAWESMWELYAPHLNDTLAAFILMCDEDEHHRPNRHPGFQAAKAAIYKRFSK